MGINTSAAAFYHCALGHEWPAVTQREIPVVDEEKIKGALLEYFADSKYPAFRQMAR
jgi:hypothetical protein